MRDKKADAPAKGQRTITLSKGGTKERTIPINELMIPDLWHISQSVREIDPVAGNAINECWHMAHDLKRELEDNIRERRLLAALRAITARIEGEFDNPALVAFGPLMANTDADVIRIAESAIRKAGAK